jgi:hypothetical protein
MDSQQPKPPATVIIEPASEPSDEIGHADGRMEHTRVHHEETDVRFRAIAAAVLMIGASLAAVVGAIRLFVHEEAATDVRQAARPGQGRSLTLPAQPRLEALQSQPSDRSFEARSATAEARLHSFGPADDAGYVHIPIEKAMQKLAADLQSHQPPPRQPKSQGLVGGGEANSGRLLREGSP